MNPFGGSVSQTPGTGDGFIFSTFIELREERRFLYTKNRRPPGWRLRPGGMTGDARRKSAFLPGTVLG